MLIKEGHLLKYVQQNEAPRCDIQETKITEEDRSPDLGPVQVTLFISWGKASAMVISVEGLTGQLIIVSVKRKFEELITANSILNPTLNRFKGKSEFITFYFEELPGGAPNSNCPLLIREKMENFYVLALQEPLTRRFSLDSLHGIRSPRL